MAKIVTPIGRHLQPRTDIVPAGTIYAIAIYVVSSKVDLLVQAIDSIASSKASAAGFTRRRCLNRSRATRPSTFGTSDDLIPDLRAPPLRHALARKGQPLELGLSPFAGEGPFCVSGSNSTPAAA